MIEILVILACLILNAVFAALEMAFVSIPKPELRALGRQGNLNAQYILKLRQDPERTLSIIQIGITLVGALSAAVGGAGAIQSIEPFLVQYFNFNKTTAELIAILIIVLPLTYFSVVFGELIPKSLALKNPTKIAFKSVGFLKMADTLFSPAITLLEWSTKKFLRSFLQSSIEAPPQADTQIEIDSLPQHHQQAILNLAHIEKRKIKDILLPWKDVNHIRQNDSIEVVVQVIFASGHTRLPVVDEEGHAIGVLHTKEALGFREAGHTDWKNLIRPLLIAQPNDSIINILRVMQKNRSHMVAVVDPTSSNKQIGIVTLEDISEEIWGDIFDEDDDSMIRKVFADRVKSKITIKT